MKSRLSVRKVELGLLAKTLKEKKTLYGDEVKHLLEESLSSASKYSSNKNKIAKKSPNVVLR